MTLLPSVATSYTLFFYLGIVFFLVHLLLFGVGLNLSYFGLILIYIGWAKPELHTWFRYMLWIFIWLDMYANYRIIRERYLKEGLDEVAETAETEAPDEPEEDDSLAGVEAK
jgi:hypothetical protein